METARRVTIVAPARSSLGAAMHAALVARGWSSILVTVSTERPDEPVHGRTAPTLAVLEDDRGTVHIPVFRGSAQGLVCVGSIDSVATLIPLAAEGAQALDQAAPFLALLAAVEDALLATTTPRPASQVDELLRRQAESAALASLTAAENDVLRGMMAGLSAVEIATRSHRSVHTIRSQIKAVLAKLGVQAQIAAVAMAHRSGHSGWLGDVLARFHQFW